MSNVAIALRNVTFGYEPNRPILRNVGLELRERDGIALMGRNGAGKTTALHVLVGLLRPQCGHVEAFGRVCRCEHDFVEVRRRVALMFQDSEDQLFCPTVVEDVAFGPLNLGKTAREARRLATNALNQVGMNGYEERVTHHLSAGEKKSIALASLLSMEPEVLLMDEPSGNLDPGARRRLIELLRSFQHTKIVATHDLELVVEVCSRVVVLDDGKVMADGTPREILGDECLMRAHGLETPHVFRHLHPH